MLEEGQVKDSFSFFPVFWYGFCDNLLENASFLICTGCLSQRD